MNQGDLPEDFICKGCKNICQTGWCWCGEDEEAMVHGMMDGHPFVPYGCLCLHGSGKRLPCGCIRLDREPHECLSETDL
jgi:hypothetical protein